MRHNFKTEFLVCLDLSNDLNYVVGRSSTMDGARNIARKAKEIFSDKVYITKEMVLRQSLSELSKPRENAPPQKGPSQQAKERNKQPKEQTFAITENICKCGKKPGKCVGNLQCNCSPIAACKKADKYVPFSFDNRDDDNDDLSDFDVEDGIEFEDNDVGSEEPLEEEYEDEGYDEDASEDEEDFEGSEEDDEDFEDFEDSEEDDEDEEDFEDSEDASSGS